MSSRNELMAQLLIDIDSVTNGAIRFLAGRTSRRSFIGKLGVFMTGMGVLPVLPMFRSSAEAQGADIAEIGNDQECEYWRYCAFSGFLCTCCGGTITQCPPGSETATVAWVGTCHNPTDGKDYLISYNDCCGQASCGRCGCHGSEGDRPVYFPSKSNSILWCFGSKSHAYHCTLSRIIGRADDA